MLRMRMKMRMSHQEKRKQSDKLDLNEKRIDIADMICKVFLFENIKLIYD